MLCGETFPLPSSLKNHVRLRKEINDRGVIHLRNQSPPSSIRRCCSKEKQRLDPTPQRGPSILQSDPDGPRKQRRDSSPQAGP
ncbi:hypothetical protein AVEN_26958-1 [Araneus ventricosus]|uniref:C2H2-type domain-containing protein n=1 Tax=Araneus ventricosus TaxID=182803 RepID=A0A4Y2X0Z4_ARAVE|nr:hypothetical protein AVEN_26958-1 [Araneus ventricosus]